MRVCVSCRRVWLDGDEFCPADGHTLVPLESDGRPLVGNVLDDRYRIMSLLGAGGMGFVCRGEQVGLGRPIAIKMLYAERTRDPASLARFRREALTLATLDHPGIVRVIDYGDGDGNTPYIVMEEVHGPPLDAVLRKRGRLQTKMAVEIAAQLAEALAAAHDRGVTHRDLKPANIHIDERTEHLTVRILDFGLAHLHEASIHDPTGGARLTRQGMITGTPEYMAPEQIRGKETDSRTDLYALGVVLYEMLAGTPPFYGASPQAVVIMHLEKTPPRLIASEIPAAVSHELGELARTLLDKSPSNRPQSANEVARYLRAALKRIPDHPVPTGTTPSPAEAAATESFRPPPRRSVSVSPWGGLTDAPDADRALEAAISAAQRGRRVRRVVGFGVLTASAALAGWFGIRYTEAQRAAPAATSAPIRLKVQGWKRPSEPGEEALGPAIRSKSPSILRIPGGQEQARYERARRELDQTLAARGIRTRDVRSHPGLRSLWRAQEQAASTQDFDSAGDHVAAIQERVASLRTEDVLVARLTKVERDIGATRSPLEDATIRALHASLRGAAKDRSQTRDFLERVEHLEQLARVQN